MRSLILILALFTTVPAQAERLISPDEETPERALLDAVRAVADGRFESFIAEFCHPGSLCVNPSALIRVQRDILPKIQAKLQRCLHGEQRSLEVLGVDGDREDPDARLVFGLDCDGQPHTVQVHRFRARWWVASI